MRSSNRKPPRYNPMAVSEQVGIIYAATQGYLDKVPVEKVRDFEARFIKFLNEAHPELLDEISSTGELKSIEKYGKVCADFAESYLSGVHADVR